MINEVWKLLTAKMKKKNVNTLNMQQQHLSI